MPTKTQKPIPTTITISGGTLDLTGAGTLITSNPSALTINQGGTLLLDETDLRFSDKSADLVKILNNGTVDGLPVLRTLQNTQKEFNPAAFTVYGPKIVAMRGSFRDDALEKVFFANTARLLKIE